MSITVIDKRGRIVIPSRVRRKLKIKEGDHFLVVNVRDDMIVLKKIDIRELVKSIVEEITKSCIDLDAILNEVEREANIIAKKKIEEISSRY